MTVNIVAVGLTWIINVNETQILGIDMLSIGPRIQLFSNKELPCYQPEFDLGKLLHISMYNIIVEFSQRIFIV